MQNLSECQLLDAGKLQEAAKLKDDNEMLLQIGGRDCVALEVLYHKRCYLQYTYPVTHVRSSKSEIYSNSFDLFCKDILCEKIYIEKQVTYLNERFENEDFVEVVKNTEGKDASNYNISRLKARIVERYADIIFNPSSQKNKSDIVLLKETVGTISEEHLGFTEDAMEMPELFQENTSSDVKPMALSNLYMTALELRSLLRSCQ